MKKATQKKKTSRNGKHKLGNVRMGMYTSPYRKAVAILLAKMLDMSMTNVMWGGIEILAKTYNVLDKDGNVNEEFKQQLELEIEIVKQCEVNG